MSDTTYVPKHRERTYAETIAERLDREKVRSFKTAVDEAWRPDPGVQGTGIQTFPVVAQRVAKSGATLAMGRDGRWVIVFPDGLHLAFHSPQVLSDAQADRFDADAREDNAVAASTLAAVGVHPEVKASRKPAEIPVFTPCENRSIPAVDRIEGDARAAQFAAEQHTKTVEGWE